MSGDEEAIDLAKAIYSGAFQRYDELCNPYATVIDIDKKKLPTSKDVERWTGTKLADTLRHNPHHPDYNPHFRQLIHVAYKVASEYGVIFTGALKTHKAIVGQQVFDNIYHRHIMRLFAADKA
jgi:hypothetical protein